MVILDKIKARYTFSNIVAPALTYPTTKHKGSIDYCIRGDFVEYLLRTCSFWGNIRELNICVNEKDLEEAVDRIDTLLTNRLDLIEDRSKRVIRKENSTTLYANSRFLLPIKVGIKNPNIPDIKIEVP